MREPALELPYVVELVNAALALREASLVIYRERTLVEFRTDRLTRGLSLYREGKHTSWQIGAFEDHHCHVDVGACNEVVFGAEPVSCQGGRLNYTAWFLVPDACGNPYRPRAYFSVTLSSPYDEEGRPRWEVIEPMLALGRRFAGRPGVLVEPAFAAAMDSGRNECAREE